MKHVRHIKPEQHAHNLAAMLAKSMLVTTGVEQDKSDPCTFYILNENGVRAIRVSTKAEECFK